MRVWLPDLRLARLAAALLLVLALAGRAAAPAGYMPAEQSGIMLAMCTEHGAQQVWMPLGDPTGGEEEAAARDACPYAVAVAALALPTPPAVPAPAQRVATQAPPAERAFATLAQTPRRPPGRAPPLLA